MLVLWCALWLGIPPELSPSKLHRAISEVVASPTFQDGFWGIMVYAPIRNKILFSIHEDKNFRPASNMKIVTTLLAMEQLGPDYRFETAFYHTGALSNGVLDGDLVIRGTGDPSFSGNYTGGAFQTQNLLDVVADRIKSGGIQRIEGDIIGVEDFFDQDMIQRSWEWDDIGQGYGTPVTALSLNDGWIQIQLEANELGETQVVVYPPGIPDFDLDLDLIYDGDEPDLDAYREWTTNYVRIKGRLPRCTRAEIEQSAWNPALHFVQTLKDSLMAKGISVDGQAMVTPISVPDDAVPILSMTSLPLANLAQTLMKESQNHYADCFLLTAAKRVTGIGDFDTGAELAADLITRVSGSDSVEELGFSMLDGSGLSSHNAIQPNQLVALLRFGLERPYLREWLATFPVMGVDGTLEKRGSSDGSTVGNVWAKTGYIFRSRCLSGYVETRAGEPLIFSIMVNNYSCETRLINAAQDEICGLLTRLKPNRKVKKSGMRYLISRPNGLPES